MAAPSYADLYQPLEIGKQQADIDMRTASDIGGGASKMITGAANNIQAGINEKQQTFKLQRMAKSLHESTQNLVRLMQSVGVGQDANSKWSQLANQSSDDIVDPVPADPKMLGPYVDQHNQLLSKFANAYIEKGGKIEDVLPWLQNGQGLDKALTSFNQVMANKQAAQTLSQTPAGASAPMVQSMNATGGVSSPAITTMSTQTEKQQGLLNPKPMTAKQQADEVYRTARLDLDRHKQAIDDAGKDTAKLTALSDSYVRDIAFLTKENETADQATKIKNDYDIKQYKEMLKDVNQRRSDSVHIDNTVREKDIQSIVNSYNEISKTATIPGAAEQSVMATARQNGIPSDVVDEALKRAKRGGSGGGSATTDSTRAEIEKYLRDNNMPVTDSNVNYVKQQLGNQ